VAGVLQHVNEDVDLSDAEPALPAPPAAHAGPGPQPFFRGDHRRVIVANHVPIGLLPLMGLILAEHAAVAQDFSQVRARPDTRPPEGFRLVLDQLAEDGLDAVSPRGQLENFSDYGGPLGNEHQVTALFTYPGGQPLAHDHPLPCGLFLLPPSRADALTLALA